MSAGYRPYPAYKDSGVEWLGEVPAHWEVQTLRRILQRRRVKNGTAERPMLSLSAYRGIVLKEYEDEALIRPTEENQDYVIVRPGQLVVNPMWVINSSIGVSSLNGIVSPAYRVYDVSSKMDGAYLHNLAKSAPYIAQYNRYIRGLTTYDRSVRENDFLNIECLIPSPAEQRAIAAFLDRRTAEIDALIAAKERLIALLREKRAALITQAVTKGLDPAAPMKDSGVEWLGEVPAHWEVQSMKRVAGLAYGDSLPSSARSQGEVQVYGSNGPVGENDLPNTLAPVIVIGRKGSYGKTHYVDVPVYAIDTTFYIDRRTSGADLKWLYFAIQVLNLDSYSEDSAVPGLSRGYVYTRQVPFPPLPEQRAIAAFLDRRTAEIDALIAAKERLIALLREKRAALITQAVTKGLDPAAPMKDSGVEWLGEVPAHWEVKRLKDSVLSCQNGVWGDEPTGEEDSVCVRVADFDRARLRVDLSEPTYRSIDSTTLQNRRLSSGDLLLEKSGGGEKQLVGAVMLFEHSVTAVCSNFVARIQLRSSFDASFLTYMHAMLYHARVNARSIKQNTGIQNLDSTSYLSERVAYPPLPEQRAIAAFLDRGTAEMDELIERVRDAIARLQEYRTAIISAAVTGKIDVRALGS